MVSGGIGIRDGKRDSAQIRIDLVDQNDNAPTVSFPMASRDVVQVLVSSTRKHDVICQMNISDRDQGENGRVFAQLKNSNSLVTVSNDGKIVLAKNVDHRDLGMHPILVRVQDMGEPSLFTTARVCRSYLIAKHRRNDSNKNRERSR